MKDPSCELSSFWLPYFLKNKTMNGSRHLRMPKNKLSKAIEILQTSSPFHKAKMATKWLAVKKYVRLDWPRNSPDITTNENLRHVLKTVVQF